MNNWTVIPQAPIDGIDFGKLQLKSVAEVREGVKYVVCEMCTEDHARLIAVAPAMLRALIDIASAKDSGCAQDTARHVLQQIGRVAP